MPSEVGAVSEFRHWFHLVKELKRGLCVDWTSKKHPLVCLELRSDYGVLPAYLPPKKVGLLAGFKTSCCF